jgi:hypothetical protein
VVARWLAEQKAAGTPALADVSTSGAARVSLAATQNGLDISGTLFRIGGEPYTPGKAKAVADAGALVVNRYAMVEAGAVGLGCSNPIAEDDMHITIDKLAVLSRDKPVGSDGDTVPALVYTSLMPNAQTIMLNAESGDCATLEERDCGCPFWDLGYKVHISGLRGYDKLTSEGVTFMGSELYKLVEEVLPARFGGNPMDYQLVEEEDQGLPRVSIIVSNRVGQIDEKAVIDAVIEGLKSHYVVGATMANQWRQGNTLRVRRQDPYTSGTRKVLPLHIIRTPKSTENGTGAPAVAEPSVQESKS